MKNKRIRIGLVAIVAAMFASAFAACNVYEKVEVEEIRCPKINSDTIGISDWENKIDS